MKKSLDDEILDLLSSSERSLTISQIGTILHHARYTIARHLDTLLLTGIVSMRQHGSKKKFFMRKDLPSPSILTISPYIQILLNRNFSIRWVSKPVLQISKSTMEELIGEKFERLEIFFGGISSIAEIIKQIQVGESRIIEDVLTVEGKPLIYRFVYTHISVNTGHTLIIITGEDITHQKEVEQEVRNNENRFTTLVNNISGIVYRLNIQTNQFEYCNDQFRKITGYLPEPNSTGYFSPLIPFIIPEDRDLWYSIVQSSLISGEPYEVEYRIRHINGNFLHVLERGQPVYDESDHPLYIDGIIFDISKIKRLEQKLRLSEQNYRILAESSPDIIFVIDKDDKVLFVNSIAANFLHLPAHKIIGKPRGQFFPLDIGLAHHENIRKVFNTGESLRCESVIEINDHDFWQDTYLVPLPDEQGEVYAVLGKSRDITEKKERERSQQKSEERLQKISRMARIGGWEIDSVGNTLSWTEETFRIHELETDHVPNVAEAIRFYHPEDQSNVASAIQSAIDSGGGFDFEARLITAKKNLRWVRAIGNAVLRNGHSVGMWGMVQDITEQRQAEEELRENNELFSIFMRHSPIYTFIKEVTPTQSRVLQVSDNFNQMIGIPAKDMTGKTMEELFPAEFAAKITADDWSIILRGEATTLREDYRGLNYYTVKFPFVIRGKTCIAGYTTNITDRLKNEQALQKQIEELRMHQTELEIQNKELKKTRSDLEESRDKFMELYDFSPVGDFTLNDKAIIVEVNLTGASMFRIVRQDLIQNWFKKFVIPSDHDKWDRFFLCIIQQGKKQTCVLQIKRIDETMFFARLEGSLIIRRDGSCQVRFVMSDVSEQRRAEKC